MDSKVDVNLQSRTKERDLASKMYRCSVRSCEQHREGQGFYRFQNLKDHMKRVHHCTDEDAVSEHDGYSTDDTECSSKQLAEKRNAGPHRETIVEFPWKGRGQKSAIRGGDVTVNSTYLKEMESMIKDLQRRVDMCERSSPDSPVSSYASSRRGSTDSISESDKDIRLTKRRARRLPSIEIIHEPSRFNPPPPPPPLDPLPGGVKTSTPKAPEILPIYGPRPEIVRWKQYANAFGNAEWQKESDLAMPDAIDYLDQKPILTIIREFDRNKEFWRQRLQIASPSIIGLLENLSQYDTNVNSDGGSGLKSGELHLTEPFMVLFHSRRQLQEKAASIPRQIGDPVQLMCDFLRRECGEVTAKLDDLESPTPSGLIAYPDLWLLYPPGTVVYSQENGEYEAFVIESLRGMAKRQRGQRRYSHGRLDLTCWSINYDGEVYGRTWTIHTISPFHGNKEINSLELVPEKFLPGKAETRTALISRGSCFWQLQGQNLKEYTGEMWSQHNSDEPERVMVDHLTYQRRNNWPISVNKKRGPTDAQSKNWQDSRFARCDSGRRFKGRARRSRSPLYTEEDVYSRESSPERTRDDDRYTESYKRYRAKCPARQSSSDFTKYDLLKPDSIPDELTLLLCPQHVHGYCLRDKVWKDLNVTQLQPVAFRKNAWDRLVLDAEYKDIIQAMVSSYVDKTAMLDDLIAGKGAGLVALLHGPPGSGKTLTAECVADSFEKPLYQVTCGDIGTDPECLEERLEEIFDYAVTWGAVLLLDEADIFLQDRDYANLERNALVSIFLRTLEYFNGVLFLTTNRVGTFDQAFQSRIHVTLGLPSLDQERRTSVWVNFLQDLAGKGAITGSHYHTLLGLVNEKWSKEKLNGRQIRNAVRTALVVAEKKGNMVGEKEFETVLKIGREFEGYMGMLGKGEVNAGLEGFQEV